MVRLRELRSLSVFAGQRVATNPAPARRSKPAIFSMNPPLLHSSERASEVKKHLPTHHGDATHKRIRK